MIRQGEWGEKVQVGPKREVLAGAIGGYDDDEGRL